MLKILNILNKVCDEIKYSLVVNNINTSTPSIHIKIKKGIVKAK